MAYRRENGRTHMDKLIEHSLEFATKVLDYGISTTVRDPMDKNFAVIYNYSLIDPGPDDPASQPHRYLALMTMARFKQLDLLKHPLSSAVMQEKWTKFAITSLLVDLIFYVLFLTCLTIFVMDQGPLRPTEMDEQGCRNTSAGMKQPVNATSSFGSGSGRPKLTNWRIIVEKSVVTCLLLIRILLELLKLIHKRLSYFMSIEVYFYLSLYFSTFLFMYPPDSEPCMWNWMFGLVSIVLAWSLVLFQIECVSFTGLYSLMFQKVLASLVKVLLIFCFFIMAFAMAFYSSMRSSTPFSTVPYAILKTFDMTVGELEFVTYFVTADYGSFQTAVQCVFTAFVVIMPIALMNLLIGIAVGDIEGITRDAELQLLAIKVLH
uniref:Ion_trans domain-containing protein n=1 Tax=Macrostomum lignano TaxID=282301 RepID=A0A1I8HFV5_9PLAT